MLEIARLLENALANNRSGLRKAAKQTLASADLSTTVRELLASEAGHAIRELTIKDLEEALIEAGAGVEIGSAARANGNGSSGGGRRVVVAAPTTSADSQSRDEFMYRRILEVLAESPGLTIGQLGKQLDLETAELRAYVSWMRQVGKVVSTGRARATRYSLPMGVDA